MIVCADQTRSKICLRESVFKATALAITFVICFSSLGTVWGTEHSSATDVNVASDYEWKLAVDGMVDQPLNLTLSQIVVLPGTKVNADLYCFSTLVYAGNWVGVRLSVLLEESGLLDGVEYIQFVALDGYATFVDISTALREDVILAYELNGQSLPEILRLVLPYENGDKWIALITKINAVTVPVSAPAQPNLTPTTFQEASKSQTASSPQPSDESTQTFNESNMPPVVSPSQLPDNSIIQLQEFMRARSAQIGSEPTEPTSTAPDTTEPTTPEPTEPELTATSESALGTTEIAIIAAVSVACVIGLVSFWVLKKRNRFY